jgi:TonB family protein
MLKNYNKIILFEIGSALFFMAFGTLILIFSLISENTLSELYHRDRIIDAIQNQEGLSQTSILSGEDYLVTLETDIHDDNLADMDSIIRRLTGLQKATPTDHRNPGARDIDRAVNNAEINGLAAKSNEFSLDYKQSRGKSIAKPHIAIDLSKRDNVRSEEIALVITSHNDAIEHCYKQESFVNPNLKGEILVAFTISYSGRVKELRIVRSSLRNKKVETCIISRIRGWRFQPLDLKEGDITVTQKYIFS